MGIIDYGMGNLGSVTNACRFLNLPSTVIDHPRDMASCSAIILPGVGAFGDCMAHLREHGFVDPIRRWIDEDRPFLGICLGLQVLFEGSEESPGVQGMGVLEGVVRKFRLPVEYKVPHIGWSRVRQQESACPLFHGIADEHYFYFVHSFYAPEETTPDAVGITTYGFNFASALQRNALMAVQFHPEKSQRGGLHLLRNFVNWAQDQERSL